MPVAPISADIVTPEAPQGNNLFEQLQATQDPESQNRLKQSIIKEHFRLSEEFNNNWPYFYQKHKVGFTTGPARYPTDPEAVYTSPDGTKYRIPPSHDGGMGNRGDYALISGEVEVTPPDGQTYTIKNTRAEQRDKPNLYATTIKYTDGTQAQIGKVVDSSSAGIRTEGKWVDPNIVDVPQGKEPLRDLEKLAEAFRN